MMTSAGTLVTHSGFQLLYQISSIGITMDYIYSPMRSEEINTLRYHGKRQMSK